MKDLDFLEEQADIGTATVVAKLSDGLTLTNKIAGRQSRVDYVATRWKAFPTCITRNRDQTADIYSNQTELNAKFLTGPFKHMWWPAWSGPGRNYRQLLCDQLFRHHAGMRWHGGTTRLPAEPLQPDRYDPRQRPLYDATIDTIGPYLTDTIHLSEHWIVNGGIG